MYSHTSKSIIYIQLGKKSSVFGSIPRGASLIFVCAAIVSRCAFFWFSSGQTRGTPAKPWFSKAISAEPLRRFPESSSSFLQPRMVPNFSNSNRIFSTSFTRHMVVAGLTVHDRLRRKFFAPACLEGLWLTANLADPWTNYGLSTIDFLCVGEHAPLDTHARADISYDPECTTQFSTFLLQLLSPRSVD